MDAFDPTLITVVVCSVVVGIWRAVAMIRSKLHRRGTALAVPRALEDSLRIRDELKACRLGIKANRGVLLASHNGGGIPRADTQLKSSVIEESSDPDLGRVKRRWQNQPLDTAYKEMLARVFSRHGKPLYLQTPALDRGDLKALYERDGVGASFVLAVLHTPTQSFYLSFNFSEGAEPVDPEDPVVLDTLRVHSARIRTVLERSYDVSAEP